MVIFPDLHREDTLEALIIGALSAVAGGLLLPWSYILAAIAVIPFNLWILYSVRFRVLNGILRYRWSQQYSRRLNSRQLRVMLEAEPERFIVHIRYFGGFDRATLCPAAVIEDLKTEEMATIYPANSSVPAICERLGVQLLPESAQANN